MCEFVCVAIDYEYSMFSFVLHTKMCNFQAKKNGKKKKKKKRRIKNKLVIDENCVLDSPQLLGAATGLAVTLDNV